MQQIQGRWLLATLVVCALSACGGATAQEHLDRARGHRAEGETNAAIIELKNALQKDPALGEARLALGELYLEMGDFEGALKELERALDAGVAETRVLPPLLETKIDLGRTQEVLGALESRELTPRLRAIRGEALLVSGDVSEGRAELESALAADPSLPRPYLALAMDALAGPAPDAPAALDLLNKGTAAAPSARRLWLALGEVQLRSSQVAPAQTAFEKARALPGNDFLPEVGLARIRLLENDPAGAGELLDGVIARAPKYPLAHHLKGVIALAQGDLDAAESSLQTVLSVAPDYPPSLLALASVKYAQKEANQAESLLRRYVALDPDSIAARKALAALLLEAGRAGESVQALAPVAERLTEGNDLALLGTAYLRAGQLDGASRYLTAAADALPESAEVKTQLALSLAAAGDDTGALAKLDEIVPSGTLATESEVLKVLLNLRKGNADAALAAAERLVASGTQTPLAYNVLGAVQLARKDVAAARAAFESSLEADPKFGAAALNLARLDLAEGRTGDARKRLESSLAAEPANQGVLLALAQLELAAGAADKAIEYLESAREADATALAPRVVLARVALARGDLATAEAASAEAEALRGDAVDVLLVRAQLKAASGKRAELSRYLDALESQLAQGPPNANAMRLQVGELQRQAGRVAPARTNLTAALSEPATETPALASLVQLETAAGDLDAARAYLTRLREKKIDAVTVEELDGDLAVRSGDLDAAATHYANAAKSSARGAVTKLAMVQARQGKANVGVATLEDWLEANPNDDVAALLLASMRIGTGDAAQARADYESLLPRHGNNPVLLNNLAWLYFDAKDPRAEDMARRAHAAAPDNADVADTLGWILVHSEAPGAASEGLALLEKAATQGNAPSVLYHLAVAQEKAGRTREARATVARALASERFAERTQAEELAKRLEEG